MVGVHIRPLVVFTRRTVQLAAEMNRRVFASSLADHKRIAVGAKSPNDQHGLAVHVGDVERITVQRCEEAVWAIEAVPSRPRLQGAVLR